MSVIKEEQLKQIMPRITNAQDWVRALNNAMIRFEINTPQRTAAFLAQVAHESAEFNRLVENLNYSAIGLMKTFKRFFPTLEKAKQFERNPKKIANHVYANRLDNGGEASGDGWRFRGRGILQITGRGNYREVGQALSLPLESQPELLELPDAAALSAAHFWKSRGLNILADDRNDDNDEKDFEMITKRINGGLNGLKDRKEYWGKAKRVLGAV